MEAQVGDELVIESPELGTSGRRGTIVAIQNADGSPPYVVHWLAGDYDSLIDPGPAARVERRYASRPPSWSYLPQAPRPPVCLPVPGRLHPVAGAVFGHAG